MDIDDAKLTGQGKSHEIEFGDGPVKLTPPVPKAYFEKIPRWIIDSGALEVLKAKASKLLLVLARRAHFVTGNGRISNKNIAKVAGICLSSVPGYMRELRFFGIIKTWRHGWVRYYQIQFEPPPDIVERVAERYFDKCPKNSDTYRQDKTTGKFTGKRNPRKSELASMKFSDVA